MLKYITTAFKTKERTMQNRTLECFLLSIGVIILITGLTNALDTTKIAHAPLAQKNFNFERVLGRWYVQADVATCSWSGVNEFNDWVVEEIRDENGVIGRETWRSATGDCTTVSMRVIPQSETCGSFVLKDSFGGVISGDQIVVATDYKTFLIEWGCTKRSFFNKNKCDDPYLTISTRQAHPKPYTFKIVEMILQKIWKVSLVDLRRYKHENPCLPPRESLH